MGCDMTNNRKITHRPHDVEPLGVCAVSYDNRIVPGDERI